MDKQAPVVLYLVVVTIIAVALYSCNAAIGSVSDDWSPESQASAAATATAVAPILESTRTFNRDVVPAVQAEEAAQACETVRAQAALDRAVSRAAATVKIAVLVVAAVLAVSIGSAGTMILVLATVIFCRSAVELAPARVLPGRGRPVQLPGVVYDPGSDAIIDIGVPAPANVAKIAAVGTADAAKIAAVARAIRGDTSRGLTRADQRIFELEETSRET